jgi:hypothetical protein
MKETLQYAEGVRVAGPGYQGCPARTYPPAQGFHKSTVLLHRVSIKLYAFFHRVSVNPHILHPQGFFKSTCPPAQGLHKSTGHLAHNAQGFHKSTGHLAEDFHKSTGHPAEDFHKSTGHLAEDFHKSTWPPAHVFHKST